jgi:hypothetical protein
MSPTRNGASWPGCHGVRLDGPPMHLGVSSGVPLAFATIVLGDVAPADGTRLWSQPGEAATLARRDDGRLVLSGPTATALEIDRRDAVITVAPGDAAVQRQLVASFAVPLLLHGHGVLLVHGSACALDGDAIVVCADSGSGKSNVLVRMIDDGWQAISEDLCAIDLRGDTTCVWPGPPWVRVAHGEPGPRDGSITFESSDKVAWDVSGSQATEPTKLARIVLLDPPGGDVAETAVLTRPDALRALARHAVWLEDPDQRGRRLFEPVARVVSKVPVVRLRLPRRAEWRDAVPESLRATASAT